MNVDELLEALKESELKVNGTKAVRQKTDMKLPVQIPKKWQNVVEKDKWEGK